MFSSCLWHEGEPQTRGLSPWDWWHIWMFGKLWANIWNIWGSSQTITKNTASMLAFLVFSSTFLGSKSGSGSRAGRIFRLNSHLANGSLRLTVFQTPNAFIRWWVNSGAIFSLLCWPDPYGAVNGCHWGGTGNGNVSDGEETGEIEDSTHLWICVSLCVCEKRASSAPFLLSPQPKQLSWRREWGVAPG